MKESKYKDLLLEGRWLYGGETPTKTIEFVNIFNKNKIALSRKQIEDVLSGRTTVGKIMCRRLKSNIFECETKRAYQRQKRKYATKGGR